jgi:hypothetical protein
MGSGKSVILHPKTAPPAPSTIKSVENTLNYKLSLNNILIFISIRHKGGKDQLLPFEANAMASKGTSPPLCTKGMRLVGTYLGGVAGARRKSYKYHLHTYTPTYIHIVMVSLVLLGGIVLYKILNSQSKYDHFHQALH